MTVATWLPAWARIVPVSGPIECDVCRKIKHKQSDCRYRFFEKIEDIARRRTVRPYRAR
jgi:hypothetical protein